MMERDPWYMDAIPFVLAALIMVAMVVIPRC